jgi:RNA-directed DNA polymerase
MVESGSSESMRIVYCKGLHHHGDWHCQSFDFLGYTFRPRSARNYRGELFVSFSPAISRKALKSLRQKIRREWRLKACSHLSLDDIANRINPIITGWINYYGQFCRSALYPVLDHINTGNCPLGNAKIQWVTPTTNQGAYMAQRCCTA